LKLTQGEGPGSISVQWMWVLRWAK